MGCRSARIKPCRGNRREGTGYRGHEDGEGEMLLVVRLTLEKMPERRRLIFELSRFKGLSYKEIAEKLNVSIRTVEHQVYLALIELKKVLLFLFFLFSFK